MKLVLRREQRKNLIGRIVFNLDVRADMSGDEQDAIERYALGDMLLYEKYSLEAKGRGIIGRFIAILVRLAHNAINTSVKARDLIEGKRVQCGNIAEMVVIETEIRDEAATLGKLIKAAMSFGGEEAIPI